MTFALLAGPANFSVEAASGIVRFTPTQDQLGAQAVSLEVRNDAGRDVLSFDLVVFPAQNAPPVAAANGPYASLTGQPVQFSSAGTRDPDGQPLRVLWNFGDGSTSTNPNPIHVYNAPGRYLASLFVNDGYGGTARARANVEVSRPNRPPTIALAGAPSYTVRLGEALSLDASASFDLDGDPLTFTWIWDDGQTGTGAAPRSPIPTPPRARSSPSSSSLTTAAARPPSTSPSPSVLQTSPRHRLGRLRHHPARARRGPVRRHRHHRSRKRPAHLRVGLRRSHPHHRPARHPCLP
ncbi:MAG: PKD domain-containing protein [Verrucomicrobia bacterium]|nr:PKD domain-containing protein [Verrucomicrobiota bacterium]